MCSFISSNTTSSKLFSRNLGSRSGFMTFCIIMFYAATLVFHCHQFTIASSVTWNGHNDGETIDRAALLAIKAGITDDPLGAMSSWSSNDSHQFCNWHGVTCGHRHQRVTKLDLHSSKLKGTLSPYIGNLTFLMKLDLGFNSLMGTIPPEIGRLRRLKSLFLNDNSFGGEIPSNISDCTRLTILVLKINRLVGHIPPELGYLSMLQVLSMASNNLTGTIPSHLGNLSSLVWLYVPRNNLVGTIPYSLGRLKNLRKLYIFSNMLSGVVPQSIFNLSSLTHLVLAANQLEGTLPSDAGTMLPNLNTIIISENSFVGSLPVHLFNSTRLNDVVLANNFFHGQVPSFHRTKYLTRFAIYNNSLGTGRSTDLNFVTSMANATQLEHFFIAKNNFSGIFPQTICNFTMITGLTLSLNNIGGRIPSCIQNLAHLQLFDAGSNLLFGTIPSSIGKLQSLGIFALGNNQLSGEIPATIGNLTQLLQVEFSLNNLHGHIPSTLGNCRNLELLALPANYLSGSIPSQIFSIQTLSIGLDLSQNFFTGSIPVQVGNLKNLNILYLDENKLSGNIPTTLSACLEIQALYLGGNQFQGSIPGALVTLKGLNELDLSRNNLSGNIPIFLGSLELKWLNLSYNNFEGQVPTLGIFNNLANFSVLGNKRLCGGVPELKLPHCNISNTPKRRRNHGRLIIVVICGLCGVTLMVTLLCLYTIRYRKRRQAPTTSCDLVNPLANLPYQSLFKATDGFSSESLIGSGTFGVVYKGTLHQDQTTVAIKKFNLERKGAVKSFMAECGALQNIRHRNLVKVITACSSIDYQGNDFKALVYEYMENGSLQDWLHSESLVGTTDQPRVLNLHQRFNIATDMAFALEYLHHQCGTPIVHCDLKPSNVLLDKDMSARVGDFGLAKFLSKSEIAVRNGNQSSSIGIRGTVGYTPPGN